jgi:hypothetical protein
MTSTEVVPVGNLAELDTLDPQAREIAVTQFLTDARDRLAFALQATGPEAVAAIKAEIATAAEATKQLGLSREIQQDAQEMVRRAEYALGKAIRAGQERGEVATRGASAFQGNQHVPSAEVQSQRFTSSPAEFIANTDESAAAYAFADAPVEQFEAALSDARAEGNLSRANVVRKIKGETLKPAGRNELMRGMRRIDPNRVIRETVLSLEGTRLSLELLEPHHFTELDDSEIDWWRDSLTQSIRALNKLRKELDNG